MIDANGLVAWWDFAAARSGLVLPDRTGQHPAASNSLTRPLTIETVAERPACYLHAPDQLTVYAHADLNPAQLTFEAWLYLTSQDSACICNHDIYQTYALAIDVQDGLLVYLWLDSGLVNLRSGVYPSRQQWTHVAFSFDGNWLRLFIDGQEVARQGQSGTIPTLAHHLVLGSLDANAYHLNGYLSDCRLWSRALSDAELNGLAAGEGLVRTAFSGQIVRAIDGDTLLALVDFSLAPKLDVVLRLKDVDAPPLGTKRDPNMAGWLALAKTREWLQAHPEVTVELHGRDKYGRSLAVVRADDTSLNQFLLDQGVARSYP